MTEEDSVQPVQGERWFATTHWSIVVIAGRGAEGDRAKALEQLCTSYWRPLYLYLRRRGYRAEDAQDLTQEFFRGFLEKNAVERADRTRGRFRTFLLSSLQNFLAKEWRKANTAKRGRGQPMLSIDADSAEAQYRTGRFEALTPERAYEKCWAVATLEEAMVKLRDEYQRSGKADLFEQLKLLLWEGPEEETYADLGKRLAMSEAAVKMAVSRLRQRARERLRRQIANTVTSQTEVDDEFRYLVSVLRT